MEDIRPGYSRVVGTNEYVQLGSLRERIYFAVKHLGSNEKRFYLSPNHTPEYDIWGSTPAGQQVIAKWKRDRQDAIRKLKLHENFIIL